MASASRPVALPAALVAELSAIVAERGIAPSSRVEPASPPRSLVRLLDAPLREPPLAVAVDIYGTLLASAMGEVGTDAYPAVSPRRSFPPDMAERLRSAVETDHARSRAAGIPWPEVDAPSVFARALGLDDSEESRRAGAKAAVEWECDVNPCAAMPGAEAFLAYCSERGLPLAIVSNAQFYTPLFIEAAFGPRLLGGQGFDPDLLLWSYETGRAKPDRWMFDELSRRLAPRGIPADRILYVGNDARNDCAAAGDAGLMTALFGGDARSLKPRLEDADLRPPATFVLSWESMRRLLCS